ncbi:MAG: HAMP domain-containing sensor histidine kinase, partial [Candidatus Competibacterales bacterium]|nr:HAMP domain-containing sensor histidine kinase [Candidatus Competibacterales bacterium]
MRRRALTGLDRRRLRLGLGLFFLLLALPTAVLVQQVFSQLKWEAFHQHHNRAVELAARIDERLREWLLAEERRPLADYGFLLSDADDIPQRSPLSRFPVTGPPPGLIGHFQVDAEGRFSTPLVPVAADPARYGLSAADLDARLETRRELLAILGRNRLVAAAPGEAPARLEPGRVRRDRESQELPAAPTAGVDADRADATRSFAPLSIAPPLAQRAFDQLNQGASPPTSKTGGVRVEDLKLESRYAMPDDESLSRQRAPLAEAEAPVAAEPVIAATESPRVRTFEQMRERFEFSLLDSGHFVLFRRVWHEDQRLIQGLLLDRRPFLQGAVGEVFRGSGLALVSDLVVAYRGEVFALFGGAGGREYFSRAAELDGALLYQTRLAAPLGDLELIFSITRLPVGPGGRLLLWTAALLVLVLCGGCYALYRLGLRQIALTRQQQDFVSAVSHELKTPLTSIRMYGEMLREGWADEDRKRSYYDYICAESERLSRLIANVLQLARMTRNEQRPELRPVAVTELLREVRTRLADPVARAGFTLVVTLDPAAELCTATVDRDGFIQVMINLIDNALKFSARVECRHIELSVRRERGQRLVFAVRDHGPGVPRRQLKKIFRLFYRSGSELTRETTGTGIGLALVEQLVR